MLSLPAYIVAILLEQAPALEAEELETLALAASVPSLEKHARARFFDRIGGIARPKPPAPRVQVLEHDPAKAAAYFRGLGIDVVHDG